MNNIKLSDKISKNYRIVRLLGKGAFGSVYLIENKKSGEKKALKILLNEYGNREVFQRFRMEYIGLKKYGTAHSVLVDEFIEDSDFFAIIMEYIPFGLLEWIKDHVKDLLALNLEIIRAVYSFHANTIAHRDLKPENIRIREDGTPVLIDFGLAFWSQDSITRLSQDSRPRFMGTVLFMPPEILFLSPQFQHIRQFRAASLSLKELAKRYPDIRQRGIAQRLLHDIYSLGMILLLINCEETRKYLLGNPILLVKKFVSNPVSFISETLKKISPELQNIIRPSLQLYPDKRIENAGMLLELYRKEFNISPASVSPDKKMHVLTSPLEEQQIYCMECGNAIVMNKKNVYSARFCPYCRAELHHRLVVSSIDNVEFRFPDFHYSSLGYVWDAPVHEHKHVRFYIGRAKDNEIVFSDPSVSRHHAIINIEKNAVYLTNLKPKNATRLNDEVLENETTITLNGHDIIQIGLLSYVIYDLIFKKRSTNV